VNLIPASWHGPPTFRLAQVLAEEGEDLLEG
jgi:hypothetical protein